MGDCPDDLVWSHVITVFIRGRARTRGWEHEEDAQHCWLWGRRKGPWRMGPPGTSRFQEQILQWSFQNRAQSCHTMALARIDCKILSFCYFKPLSLTWVVIVATETKVQTCWLKWVDKIFLSLVLLLFLVCPGFWTNSPLCLSFISLLCAPWVWHPYLWTPWQCTIIIIS